MPAVVVDFVHSSAAFQTLVFVRSAPESMDTYKTAMIWNEPNNLYVKKRECLY